MKRLLMILSAAGMAIGASPEPVNMDAAKAAIQRTAAEHATATNKPGAEGARGYASYATPDARWLPPEAPAIAGREAIAQYGLAFTSMPGFQVSWEHPHVVVSRAGDIAYSVGTYSGGGKDAQGNTQAFEGKLVNIWHKQPDGSWKIAVAIWNTNKPATTVQGAAKQ